MSVKADRMVISIAIAMFTEPEAHMSAAAAATLPLIALITPLLQKVMLPTLQHLYSDSRSDPVDFLATNIPSILIT